MKEGFHRHIILLKPDRLGQRDIVTSGSTAKLVLGRVYSISQIMTCARLDPMTPSVKRQVVIKKSCKPLGIFITILVAFGE